MDLCLNILKEVNSDIIRLDIDTSIFFASDYDVLKHEGFRCIGGYYINNTSNSSYVYCKDGKKYIVNDYLCFNGMWYWIELKQVA